MLHAPGHGRYIAKWRLRTIRAATFPREEHNYRVYASKIPHSNTRVRSPSVTLYPVGITLVPVF